MTRVLYMSDLHLEMEEWRPSRPNWSRFLQPATPHPSRGPMLDNVGKVDLVILAGDIHNGLRGVVYADQVAKYLQAPVVMVAGNHEYYHNDMATLLPALRQAVLKTKGRVSFLQNDIVTFDIGAERINVLGCSLWTDYLLNGDAEFAMQQAQRLMNDYNFIRLNEAMFTPLDAKGLHETSVGWLQQTLNALAMQPGSGKTIIVTHHAPTGHVLGRRQGIIGPAYGSEIIGKFASNPPALWVYGHTHVTHDGYVEGVHLVSAPRGYHGDKAGMFNPGLVEI